MRIPFKALIISLLILTGQWLHAQKPQSSDFEGFEDSVLALTKLGEQITIDQLSLKSFRCLENITGTETLLKTQESEPRTALYTYTVERMPDQRVNEKLIFSESRTPGRQNDPPPEVLKLPLLDKPFTGSWIEAFSFENRLANDFRPLPAEEINGRSCLVFAFESVPELSSVKIALPGGIVSLRQKGRIWIDSHSHQVVRLVGKQIKLPKGCKLYEYSISFSSFDLFGRTLSLPVRTELNVHLKDRTFVVIQEYSKFEAL